MLELLLRILVSCGFQPLLRCGPEGLAEAGIEPSVGSRGDSCGNVRAEIINGLYKTELIHRRGPWKTKESMKLGTLQWVYLFNHIRLLGPIGYIPPDEAEVHNYRQLANSREISVST
jgi:transposase InsO family protein